MPGTEREFMGTLEMLPPRDRDHHHYHLETDNSMRDFWRSTSDRESLQEMQHESEDRGRQQQTIADMSSEHPQLRQYNNYGAHVDPTMELARSSLGSSVHEANNWYNHPYNHHHQLDSATSSALISAHTTYTNFFNTCSVDHNGAGNEDHHHDYRAPILKHEPTSSCTAPESHYQQLPVPVAIPMSQDVVTFSTTMASESLARDHDMESLRRELAYKCPRSSDLLMSITSAADAAVREHGGSATSGVSSDDDEDAAADHELEQKYPNSSEHDQELRAAIVDHPYYPEMVVAHVRLFKIGAPRELRNKLDDVTKKYQRFQESSTMNIGDDPSLDFFMRSYVDLLAKLGEDLEEPFNKFMQFKDATTKSLENICGHYIETGPDETDNYGYDIGPADGAHDSDEHDTQGDEGLMYAYGDVDESIIVDPTAPEEELRKMLMLKYGRHIGGLKAEFNRVRKKGKLPSNARSILKDWFNRHSYWPYPSEVEKQYLQRICSLNLKQINNWFINERKRHWSCEGKCMHPNAKFYSNGEGSNGHQE